MDWPTILLIFFGLLIAVFFTGIPIAFGFLAVNLVCLYAFAGGTSSFFAIIPAATNILLSETMLAVPLFILMGEVLFHSGTSVIVSDALDSWVGAVPGRLSLLAICLGTIFAALSGSGIATTAMLGGLLLPEMQRKGYSKGMSAGPILGGGCLAIIMPPTFLGIILAGLANISIADFLLALIIPCLLLTCFFCIYIVIMAKIRPDSAPRYKERDITWANRIKALRHIIPVTFVIFFVVVSIFIGLATPTEAAALGAAASCTIAGFYRKLTFSVIKKAFTQTGLITCMVFMIIIGSQAFSQLLAFSGATRGLVTYVTNVDVHPIMFVILIQLAVFVMGTFMDQVSVLMISIPIFVPVVAALNMDLTWFSTLTLINIAFAGITPPFGLFLFALKGVAPGDFTMKDVMASSVPYVLLSFGAMIIIGVVPGLALFPISLLK